MTMMVSKHGLTVYNQETEKGYVPLTKGYRGYTCNVGFSIVLIAPVVPCSLDAGLGSYL